MKKLKDILAEMKGGKTAFTKDVDSSHIVDGPAKFNKPKVDSEKKPGKHPLVTKDVDSSHVVDGPAKVVKPKKEGNEKHDDTYHQKEPVQFKKPESPKKTTDVKAEKDQQDVLDRMEDTAKIASDYNSDSDITSIKESSAEKLRKMMTLVKEACEITEGPHLTEPGYGDERPAGESEAAQQAHQLNLVAKPYGNWADPKTGKVVAKTVQGKLVKVKNDDDSVIPDKEGDGYTLSNPKRGYSQHSSEENPGQFDADIDAAEKDVPPYEEPEQSPEKTALRQQQMDLQGSYKEIKASQSALERAKQLPPEKKAKLIDILKGLSGTQSETDFEDETPVDEKDMADPLFAGFKEFSHPTDRTKGKFAKYKHDADNGPSDKGDAWSGGFADNH
jgi:hypothetical protein